MRGNFSIICCLAAFAFLLVMNNIGFAERIIYVDVNATGANNGASWVDAYKYLQDALADANSSPKPVEIRVAQGIYRPDETSAEPNGSGDRKATFQLINGVTLKGGYAGYDVNETNGEIIDPNTRDIELYETILSGDLDGNDINISRPIDLIREPSRDENSYHVVTGSGTDATAILDGFTIVGGNASADSSSTHSMGAGVYNTSGGPTINNCKFIWNFASRGGAGMYNSESNPTITGCSFGQNVVYNRGDYVVNGAGMYNEESSPIVTNCLFTENAAYSGYQPYRWVNGGGIYNQQSSPTIVNCTFTRNETWYGYGGGVYNFCYSNPVIVDCTFTDCYGEWGGGIACNENSSPTIKNCIIGGNRTYQEGGGICCRAGSCPIITNSKIVSNRSDEAGGEGIACLENSSPVITNCTVAGNGSGGPGGGIYCSDNSNPMLNNCLFVGNCYSAIWCFNSSPSLENCTIVHNDEGLVSDGSSPTIHNCVVWGNSTSILLWWDDSKPWIIYSDIQGGWPGEGNIDVDPCFAAPSNGDYHLKSQAGRWDADEGRWTRDEVTSLCIDAGDPASPIVLEPFPNGGRINMGSYGGTVEASKSYFGKPVCETIVAGDINGDCIVNLKDFALLAFHWLEEH